MPTTSDSLQANTLRVSRLPPGTRDAMWSVFRKYYDGISREQFDRDLDGKQFVIVLRDGDGTVQGFSTIAEYDISLGRRSYRVVYSGDTILERRFWGYGGLQVAFAKHMLRAKLRRPWRPVYWFLISKGYKTYLLLARSFLSFWPRRDAPMEAWQKELVDTLATKKFGDQYDAERGILRALEDGCRLKEHVAPVDPHVSSDPDICFFAESNPGHVKGDELCCVGVVDAAQLVQYFAKLLRKRLATGKALVAKQSTT